jgi:hypothetical protein
LSRLRWAVIGFAVAIAIAITVMWQGTQTSSVTPAPTPIASDVEVDNKPLLTGSLQWNGLRKEIESTTSTLEQLEAEARRDFEVLKTVGSNVAEE